MSSTLSLKIRQPCSYTSVCDTKIHIEDTCSVVSTVVHNVLVGSVSFASPGAKALHNASTAQEITVITPSAANFEFRRWHDPSPMPPSPIPESMMTIPSHFGSPGSGSSTITSPTLSATSVPASRSSWSSSSGSGGGSTTGRRTPRGSRSPTSLDMDMDGRKAAKRPRTMRDSSDASSPERGFSTRRSSRRSRSRSADDHDRDGDGPASSSSPEMRERYIEVDSEGFNYENYASGRIRATQQRTSFARSTGPGTVESRNRRPSDGSLSSSSSTSASGATASRRKRALALTSTPTPISTSRSDRARAQANDDDDRSFQFAHLPSKSFRTALILDRFTTRSTILFCSNELLIPSIRPSSSSPSSSSYPASSTSLSSSMTTKTKSPPRRNTSAIHSCVDRSFFDYVHPQDEHIVKEWISCVKGWGVNEKGQPSDGGFGFGRFRLLALGRDSSSSSSSSSGSGVSPTTTTMAGGARRSSITGNGNGNGNGNGGIGAQRSRGAGAAGRQHRQSQSQSHHYQAGMVTHLHKHPRSYVRGGGDSARRITTSMESEGGSAAVDSARDELRVGNGNAGQREEDREGDREATPTPAMSSPTRTRHDMAISSLVPGAGPGENGVRYDRERELERERQREREEREREIELERAEREEREREEREREEREREEREREEREKESFIVDAIFSAHSDGLMIILRRA
ncbi:hypothetical protein D9613_006187 [Agrocybe pediades]|uniref:PAS domain-containing protein n=1 Tax=Agrocybe pediades TaxID=84607 RepID=A0A8H4QW81_9AGAR|nr:hypothetical protein D9613_006187 [Agrocybe pediades]